MLFERYNYVPPCPRCGSKRTGRYVYSTTINNAQNKKIVALALKKGELCRVKQGLGEYSEPNVYCCDCGAEWFGTVETLPCKPEIIAREMKERNISDADIKRANSNNSLLGRIKRKVGAIKEKKKIKKELKEKSQKTKSAQRKRPSQK